MSDIVFLRAWVNVEVPTYCNLVTTALQPRKEIWQGMRTTAELRRVHNIPIPHNKDSVYKVLSLFFSNHILCQSCRLYDVISAPQPIERKPRKFNPVEIPAKLQQLLPFKSKPKDRPKQKQPIVEKRVPIILEPSARKTQEAIRQLMLLKHEKVESHAHSSLCYAVVLFRILLICFLWCNCRQRRRKSRNSRRRKHTKKRKPRLNN